MSLVLSRVLLPRHSGETAFRNMTVPYGWAKRPMIHRMDQLQPRIPITMVYGSRSSVDSNSGAAIRELKPDRPVQIIVRSFYPITKFLCSTPTNPELLSSCFEITQQNVLSWALGECLHPEHRPPTDAVCLTVTLFTLLNGKCGRTCWNIGAANSCCRLST